ncbi:helix-turn-helix domain-containing protein [Alloacidobacterium dinghuense]|nr:helix-turn-helix domain-containing protein [Alloacidobacterium dinghuense]
MLIGQIRKKLDDNAVNPEYILTDSHIGYRFRET